MMKSRTLAAAGAAIALVFLGGVAAVQQPVVPKLDADSVAATLGLDADATKAIAPSINELNSVMAGHWQMAQAMSALHTRLQEVRSRIAAQLSPAQWSAFTAEMARTFGHGMAMGANGAIMGTGHMGGTAMGTGSHIGGMPMGSTGMYGGMTGATHMGTGSSMGVGTGHMGAGAGMMGGFMHQMHHVGTPATGSVPPDTGAAADGGASPRR